MPKQDLTKKPMGRPKGSKSTYVRKSVREMNEDMLKIQAGDKAPAEKIQITLRCFREATA